MLQLLHVGLSNNQDELKEQDEKVKNFGREWEPLQKNQQS